MRVACLVAPWFILVGSAAGAMIEGFSLSGHFDEQERNLSLESGVRGLLNASLIFDPARPTQLIFYLLPNGNTIEWTIGCQRGPGLDWHYDIQHIGAQTRALREISPDQNIVVVYLEADGRSWPTWRQKRPDNPKLIRQIVDQVADLVPGSSKSITLAAHSGGGSFITGFINGGDSIPDSIGRIIYLDANYSYSDDEHHGDKLLKWLQANDSHVLVVIAYDDRNVTLNGKPIVSETGGTYRASHRMIDRFSQSMQVTESRIGEFERFEAMGGRATFLIHTNPPVKILHTTLVGEMNGFLHAMTLRTPLQETWGKFAGPRAYDKWIQPAPATAPSATTGLPPRDKAAVGGKAFMATLAGLPREQRDAAIVRELTSGNVPEFSRKFVTIRAQADGIEGVRHRIEYQVMPDYLAVGSDDDFVRLPMTPMAAQKIADAFGCSLPTRKIVNDIYEQSELKLEPRPLTEKREAIETFVEHHQIIERQRGAKPLGTLIAGIKKDVVLTNRLNEKPNRVAIYGWHKLDGKPIQPLTIVHGDGYVDYSHGIRLVRRDLLVDGKPMHLEDVLKDPHLCALLSDEGILQVLRYRD